MDKMVTMLNFMLIQWKKLQIIEVIMQFHIFKRYPRLNIHPKDLFYDIVFYHIDIFERAPNDHDEFDALT